MAIYNTADDTNNFIKQGTSNNDSYYIDNTKVTIIENENAGEDTVFSTIDYTLNENIENLTLTTILEAEKIEIPNLSGEIGYLYGHPAKYRLDNKQGDNYLIFNNTDTSPVSADCGIVAVKNILIQSGIIPEDVHSLIVCRLGF